MKHISYSRVRIKHELVKQGELGQLSGTHPNPIEDAETILAKRGVKPVLKPALSLIPS